MNTDELEYALLKAERRVLEIQTKLHRWANDDPHRRFDDLHNLVADPGFLLVSWDRVRNNKGTRTAGVDGETAYYIESERGLEGFLKELREDLKARTFRPLPARRRAIPKAGGKVRYLGIATIRDRVAQASLKLVLEPIFETDFRPCSYGFRPNRRAHDAVAEVHHFASRSYEWVVEGDIKACFDEISHSALMDRVRERIGDKRILALVKAFLKAGILDEDGTLVDTDAGTPQGSILSPLLSNVALSVLDDHVAQGPGGPGASPYGRAKRRRQGLPNYRLVRYADDWCLLVSGTEAHAEALREELAGVLSTMGLRLSPEKTLITHVDEGLDFLGWRIQRHRKRGTGKQYVYVYPAKKALVAVMAKVKTICRRSTNLPLEDLLHQLNRMLRGWTAYFKYGCSNATFSYLRAYLWKEIVRWQERKHRRVPWKVLRRRYGIWPAADGVELFDPARVSAKRYYYRGTRIPTPWPSTA
ncbi:group II intron reverse transcriptase/maturase [Streptomyces halobius]|uniref:Group II intron reverse transcriptase/maturase n=1 Tax=Streptomyces halobius TaxID=2879846 RepID=A0ABY4MH07_9ACTN|nr:group II intron reverse transcriptase/maturase [Streptomyces halobius]UQA96652.1 group II intron reverse transcriptase/maturase [Streptomyces halobius]UQA97084.1 group II intron reverse transcriptase/maturase [Streptomyces halobius]